MKKSINEMSYEEFKEFTNKKMRKISKNLLDELSKEVPTLEMLGWILGIYQGLISAHILAVAKICKTSKEEILQKVIAQLKEMIEDDKSIH